MTLPLSVTRAAAEALVESVLRKLEARSVRLGSVYGMTPGSPFITTIASIPVALTVTAHSIIAVKGDGPPKPAMIVGEVQQCTSR